MLQYLSGDTKPYSHGLELEYIFVLDSDLVFQVLVFFFQF